MGLRAPKLHELSPGDQLAHIDLGQIFTDETNKTFMLVRRDPWKAYYIRWNWFNHIRLIGLRAFLTKDSKQG